MSAKESHIAAEAPIPTSTASKRKANLIPTTPRATENVKQNDAFYQALTSSPLTFHVGESKTEMSLPGKLLCQHSNVFRTMLEGEWKETKDKVIELPKTDIPTFVRIAEWLHTGEYSTSNDDEVEVKRWSDDLKPHERKKLKTDMKFNGTWPSRVTSESFEIVPGGPLLPGKKKLRAWTTYLGATEEEARDRGSVMDKSAGLMQHARLCVFADMYCMEVLQKLCLQKLRDCLISCVGTKTQLDRIVELIEFVSIESSPTAPKMTIKAGGHSRKENLWTTVLQYAAIIFESLVILDEFKQVMRGNAELGWELALFLSQRLD